MNLDLAEDVIGGVLALLFVIDILISLAWVQSLWMLAPPLFRTHRKVPVGTALPDTDAIAAAAETGTGLGPRFVFRKFDDGSVGFRESFKPAFFSLNYTPLMRGHISIDRFTGEMKVTGYPHWWVVVFAIVFCGILVVGLLRERDTASIGGFATMMAFFVALILFIRVWQAVRFGRVADHVSELMQPAKVTGRIDMKKRKLATENDR